MLSYYILLEERLNTVKYTKNLEKEEQRSEWKEYEESHFQYFRANKTVFI